MNHNAINVSYREVHNPETAWYFALPSDAWLKAMASQHKATTTVATTPTIKLPKLIYHPWQGVVFAVDTRTSVSDGSVQPDDPEEAALDSSDRQERTEWQAIDKEVAKKDHRPPIQTPKEWENAWELADRAYAIFQENGNPDPLWNIVYEIAGAQIGRSSKWNHFRHTPLDLARTVPNKELAKTYEDYWHDFTLYFMEPVLRGRVNVKGSFRNYLSTALANFRKSRAQKELEKEYDARKEATRIAREYLQRLQGTGGGRRIKPAAMLDDDSDGDGGGTSTYTAFAQLGEPDGGDGASGKSFRWTGQHRDAVNAEIRAVSNESHRRALWMMRDGYLDVAGDHLPYSDQMIATEIGMGERTVRRVRNTLGKKLKINHPHLFL